MRKKWFLSLLAAVALTCGLVGCQADVDTGQVDTEQTVQETQQTTIAMTGQTEQVNQKSHPMVTTSFTKPVADQTIKNIETPMSIAATINESTDTAASREYEFDLNTYLKNNEKCNLYSLRDELFFLSDEQYVTYIKAWIFIDNFEYFNIPNTNESPTHFLDENGNINDCYITYENDMAHIYKYMYISTYQSFYIYLQSVFTQESVDKIMTNERFLTIGNELYFECGEKGGEIYFQGGEYKLIEQNDNEVIFEYDAHQKKDEKEWIENHPLKLIHTENGWRSELFEHLRIEF